MNFDIREINHKKHIKVLRSSADRYAKELEHATGWLKTHCRSIAVEQISNAMPFRIRACFHKNRIIGTLFYKFTPQNGVILLDLFVAKLYRGKGVATALLKSVEDFAKECDAGSLTLHVFSHNQKARSLYSRLGFEIKSVSMCKKI